MYAETYLAIIILAIIFPIALVIKADQIYHSKRRQQRQIDRWRNQ